MVIARQEQDATMRRGTGGVAMFQHIAGTIHARALAVPHGEDAIVFGAGKEIDLLAAPDRGGSEVLVDPRQEVQVVLLDEALGSPEGLVQPTQRRAAIARDE